MRGLAVKCDRMTFHAESSQHRAEWQIQIQQHRPLLDVQLDVTGGVLQFLARIFHALEINAHVLERVGKFDALFVHKAARFVHIEIAGAGG